jgi:hypothetical protein
LKCFSFSNIKIFVFVLIVSASVFTGCKTKESDKGLFVTKWNNIYDGSNIHFYYEDFKSSNVQEIARRYKLSEVVGDSQDEFEKGLKLQGWLHSKLEFQKGSVSTKQDAISILEELETAKKASDREFAIVFSQAASSLGIYVRRGELRVKSSEKNSGFDLLKVCEVWSDKHNKWILIDIVNNVYMSDKNIPLGAVEVLNNGLTNVEIVGAKDVKKYIKEMSKYFYSYSIEVDNTIYGVKKSNSQITYLKPGETPQVKTKAGYLPPTIYVNNEALFHKSPKIEYIDDKSDKLQTVILMKKTINDTNQQQEAMVGGVFKNSSMVATYYLSLNGSQWMKIDKYFDYDLQIGTNNIRISEDGQNVLREIILEYRK